MRESSRNVEHGNTLLEPLFSLIQSSAGNPAAGRWEALTAEAVERMRQQGVLK